MKIGRNKPCHCGSGIKYKRCCMTKDKYPRPRPQRELTARERRRVQMAIATVMILGGGF